MKTTVQLVKGPELEDKIAQLRILSYPDFPEVHDVGYYSNLYRWYQDHPLADELYRWVSVTEEGEVVGHLTAFPQYYRIDGQRVVAHTPGDYMVLCQHGFQAIMLMRSFFRQTENCVVCDMVPAVIGVETRLGAGVVGDLKYAAKLMNVSRLPMPSVPAPLRRLFRLPETFAPARGFTDRPGAGPQEVEEHVAPPAPRPRAPIPRPVQKLLNRGLERVDETLSRGFGRDLEVEEIDEFDDSFDDLFERIAAVVPCTAEKDAAFLRWRYGAGSPQAPVTVLAVEVGGQATRLRRAQDRLPRPGRLHTRPDSAPWTPGRGQGAAARDGAALLADGRADYKVQVHRVAHRAVARRPRAARLLPPQGEEPQAAHQVQGYGPARDDRRPHQLVDVFRRRRSGLLAQIEEEAYTMVSGNGDARAAIRGWLQENVTGGRDVPNDEPLIDNGVMTSLQTVELVVFLEDTFGIVVEDEEFDEENFGSVDAIATLVESKAA